MWQKEKAKHRTREQREEKKCKSTEKKFQRKLAERWKIYSQCQAFKNMSFRHSYQGDQGRASVLTVRRPIVG